MWLMMSKNLTKEVEEEYEQLVLNNFKSSNNPDIVNILENFFLNDLIKVDLDKQDAVNRKDDYGGGKPAGPNVIHSIRTLCYC